MNGHCHCGRVRYRVAGDRFDDVGVCHCEACRRSTGGTHVTWATVPEDSFAWTGEPPAEYRSSDHGCRYFCPRCGAQLAFRSSRFPGEVDITVTTLDQPERVPPDHHTWVRSRLSWVHLDDGLPREDEECSPGRTEREV